MGTAEVAPFPFVLLEAAKDFVLSPEEKEQQRRSFAYGNTVVESPRITREMIDRAADELARARAAILTTVWKLLREGS